MPEAIQPFLDYSAVGREYAASHDGEFCSLGYLKNREAAPVQGQAAYAIRLTLTSSGRQYDLSLPAAEEQPETFTEALNIAMDRDDYEQSQQVICNGFKIYSKAVLLGRNGNLDLFFQGAHGGNTNSHRLIHRVVYSGRQAIGVSGSGLDGLCFCGRVCEVAPGLINEPGEGLQGF